MVRPMTWALMALALMSSVAAGGPGFAAETREARQSVAPAHSLLARSGPVTVALGARPLHQGDILFNLVDEPNWYSPQTQVETLSITWAGKAVSVAPGAFLDIFDPHRLILKPAGKGYVLIIEAGDGAMGYSVALKFNRRLVFERVGTDGESGKIVEKTIYY